MVTLYLEIISFPTLIQAKWFLMGQIYLIEDLLYCGKSVELQ